MNVTGVHGIMCVHVLRGNKCAFGDRCSYLHEDTLQERQRSDACKRARQEAMDRKVQPTVQRPPTHTVPIGAATSFHMPIAAVASFHGSEWHVVGSRGKCVQKTGGGSDTQCGTGLAYCTQNCSPVTAD